MKTSIRVAILLVLIISAGCATVPTGPTVAVYPSTGKPYDLFLFEDAYCRKVAGQQTGQTPQEIADRSTAAGAVVGGMIGTGLGAAIGAASGNAGAGAVIGGASGMMIGAASGSDSGRIEGRDAQRRYDNVYLQCMSAHGNPPYSPAPRYYRRYRPYVAPAPHPTDNAPENYIPLYPPPNTPPPRFSPPPSR